MWKIDHFAVDGDDAGLRVGGESVDDPASMGTFCLRGGHDLVDNGDLSRVDGHHAGEAVATALGDVGSQAGEIAEIRVDGLNGGDACGGSTGDAQRAGEAAEVAQGFILVAVGGRADCGR